MFCKNCGKPIPDQSKFCRHCGTKVVIPTSAITHLSERETSTIPELRPKPFQIMYAGFTIRLGAYVIDYLGIILVFFLIGIFLYLIFGVEEYDSSYDIVYGYLGYVIYNTISLTLWSTTLGKRVYGLEVKTEEGLNLSFAQALKRSLLQPFSTAFFGIGYWNMNNNPTHQAWHDKTAHTVVTMRKIDYGLAILITVIAAIIWGYIYSISYIE